MLSGSHFRNLILWNSKGIKFMNNILREQFQNKTFGFELNDPRFDAAQILLGQVQ